jgi:SAM-dependent methyltransferase
MQLLPEGRRSLAAYAYHLGPAHYFQPAYKFIVADIAVEHGAWLDLGCGPGWLAIHAGSGHADLDVIAIDSSETMTQLCDTNKAGRLNVTVRKMDGGEIVYPEHTFDVITAVQVAHELTDVDKVLAECFRTLKVGGRLYLYEADPDAEIEEGWISRRGGFPTNGMLKRSFQSAGMDQAAWDELKARVVASPFGTGFVEDRHGFYRRIVATR